MVLGTGERLELEGLKMKLGQVLEGYWNREAIFADLVYP